MSSLKNHELIMLLKNQDMRLRDKQKEKDSQLNRLWALTYHGMKLFLKKEKKKVQLGSLLRIASMSHLSSTSKYISQIKALHS